MQSGAFASIALTLAIAPIQAQEPATFTLSGNWEVQVTVAAPKKIVRTITIVPPALEPVTTEIYASIPVFNPKSSGWIKGAQLRGVKAQETTSPNLLDAASFTLRAGADPDSPAFTVGVDYEIDLTWGTFGRLENGAIKPGQTVYASYRHARMRLDSIVLTHDNQILTRQGEPRASVPIPPIVNNDERHLGNIFIPTFIPKLEPEHLFPILESSYPEHPKSHPTMAERLTPKTIQKLKSGEPLRILAWGDSVTDGSYLPVKDSRWQEQFVARLRHRYPAANIGLITEAWGGRNTSSYLSEPPGSAHNYREKVLDSKPDLIISEFVNDSAMKPAQVETRYIKLLADFQAMGAEWIILTPHYVRPDWMGLTRERDIDDDPRPYVAGLREFTAKHGVALADASLRYGRLWRQGIPYNTLMVNAINHPDSRGMRLFADALMELFP